MRSPEDFDAEIRSHLEIETDRLIAEGVPPAEAAARARRTFGNVATAQERFRDASRARLLWLDAFRANLRYALRGMRRKPVFAASVILTLALGIGANSAIFSVIDTVLLRPLPYPNSDRLMEIHEALPAAKSPESGVAPIRVDEWSKATRTFTALGGYYTEPQSEVSGPLPEKVVWAIVSPQYFSVWGVHPLFGRHFSPAEQARHGPSAAIVSHALWQRRFGDQPFTQGRALRIGRTAFVIAGVMPASFAPHENVDLWIPAQFPPHVFRNRQGRYYTVVGRLRDGVARETAQAELRTFYRQAAAQYPETDRDWTVTVDPLKDRTVRGARRSLWILFAAVSLLLLIACANVASLLLAQGRQRAQEIAVRFSLGAARGRIVAQMLTETALLAVLGALLGLTIAYGGVQLFQRMAADLPRTTELRLDGRIVACTFALALVTAFLSGLWPAWRSTGARARSLAQAGRAPVAAGQGSHLLLAAAQIALTLVLLVGCGLMVRTLANIRQVDPGFRAEGVTALRISAGWGETNNMPRVQQRLERTLEALHGVPGVEAAAIAFHTPGASTVSEGNWFLDGDANRQVAANSLSVTARYFDVLQMPLLEGRTCDARQDRPMLVNRSFVQRYSPDRTIVGHRLQATGAFTNSAEIIGVVGDAREAGLTQDPLPTVYNCGVTGYVPDPQYLVRTRDAGVAAALRHKVREIEPLRAVFALQPLSDHLDATMTERRFHTWLLASFALTALALAAIGVYGLVNYFVSQRVREFGLRMALGAGGERVFALVLRHGATAAVLGLAAGLALTVAASRAVRSWLFGVSPTDAFTVTMAALGLAAITLAAAAGPAWRATRIDPMRVMREE